MLGERGVAQEGEHAPVNAVGIGPLSPHVEGRDEIQPNEPAAENRLHIAARGKRRGGVACGDEDHIVPQGQFPGDALLKKSIEDGHDGFGAAGSSSKRTTVFGPFGFRSFERRAKNASGA